MGASELLDARDRRRKTGRENFYPLPADGNLRRENVLQNDEIITEVQIPASKFAAHSTYLKFKERDSMDFAMSAVAAAVAIGPNKTISEARLVLGGVAPVPWRVAKGGGDLIGKTSSGGVLTK